MRRYAIPAICLALVMSFAWVASTTTQDVRRQRWEYCHVEIASGSGNSDPNGVGLVAKIVYLTPTGPRTEKLFVPTLTGEGSPLDPVIDATERAVAKLGGEGWEMVGIVPERLRANKDGYGFFIYFKRPF